MKIERLTDRLFAADGTLVRLEDDIAEEFLEASRDLDPDAVAGLLGPGRLIPNYTYGIQRAGDGGFRRCCVFERDDWRECDWTAAERYRGFDADVVHESAGSRIMHAEGGVAFVDGRPVLIGKGTDLSTDSSVSGFLEAVAAAGPAGDVLPGIRAWSAGPGPSGTECRPFAPGELDGAAGSCLVKRASDSLAKAFEAARGPRLMWDMRLLTMVMLAYRLLSEWHAALSDIRKTDGPDPWFDEESLFRSFRPDMIEGFPAGRVLMAVFVDVCKSRFGAECGWSSLWRPLDGCWPYLAMVRFGDVMDAYRAVAAADLPAVRFADDGWFGEAVDGICVANRCLKTVRRYFQNIHPSGVGRISPVSYSTYAVGDRIIDLNTKSVDLSKEQDVADVLAVCGDESWENAPKPDGEDELMFGVVGRDSTGQVRLFHTSPVDKMSDGAGYSAAMRHGGRSAVVIHPDAYTHIMHLTGDLYFVDGLLVYMRKQDVDLDGFDKLAQFLNSASSVFDSVIDYQERYCYVPITRMERDRDGLSCYTVPSHTFGDDICRAAFLMFLKIADIDSGVTSDMPVGEETAGLLILYRWLSECFEDETSVYGREARGPGPGGRLARMYRNETNRSVIRAVKERAGKRGWMFLEPDRLFVHFARRAKYGKDVVGDLRKYTIWLFLKSMSLDEMMYADDLAAFHTRVLADLAGLDGYAGDDGRFIQDGRTGQGPGRADRLVRQLTGKVAALTSSEIARACTGGTVAFGELCRRVAGS